MRLLVLGFSFFISFLQAKVYLSATEIPPMAKALKSWIYFLDYSLKSPGIKNPIVFIIKPKN